MELKKKMCDHKCLLLCSPKWKPFTDSQSYVHAVFDLSSGFWVLFNFRKKKVAMILSQLSTTYSQEAEIM